MPELKDTSKYVGSMVPELMFATKTRGYDYRIDHA